MATGKQKDFTLLMLVLVSITILGCKKTEECIDTSKPSDVIKFDFIGRWTVEYEDNVFPMDTVEIIQGHNQYEFLLLNFRQSQDTITLFFAEGEINDIGNAIYSYYINDLDFLDQNEHQLLHIANQENTDNVYLISDVHSCSDTYARAAGQLTKL